MRTPEISLLFRNVNISRDLVFFLKSIRYIDKITSESPEIEIVLHDREQVWQNEWFPPTGSRLSLTLKYREESNYIEANGFEIDKLDFSFDGNGDTLRLRGQQTPFSKSLREKRSVEYENVTLRGLIDTIAQRQGLTVQGTVAEITFERLTQNEQSDLEFLTRLAEDYGHIIKIEGDNLIIYSWDQLNSEPADFTIDREQINKFRASKKLVGIYRAARIVYEKTDDENRSEFEIEAQRPNDSEDVLVINQRSESPAQSEAIAKEKLRKANADEWKGDVNMEGEYWQRAGVNINIESFGQFDGKWQIQEVEHNFTPDRGWSSRLKVHKL